MKSILFIVSPNLGMFDVWLPVITALKQKGSVSVTAVLPKAGLIEQVDLESVLVQKIGPLLDRVVFRGHDGAFASADSLSAAIRKNEGSVVGGFIFSFLRKTERRGVWKFFAALRKLYLLAFSRGERQGENISRFLRSADAVLYDINDSEKDYCRPLLEMIPDVPKFSLFHGTEIEPQLQPKRESRIYSAPSTTAYLYGFGDRDYYRSSLGLEESQVKVIGIPRLQRGWVKTILDGSKERVDLPWNRFVTLISRPVVEPYFSFERKSECVENIRRLVFDELGLNLVVKLHPKEAGKEIYEKIFSKETYGRRWVFSNLHPFVLSQRSIFAISFYSGIVIDFLVTAGVPSIETINIRGVKGYDDERSLRDENGEPVLKSRYNKVVLAGSSYETLRANAMRIMNGRESVVQELMENFKKNYASLDDPTSIVVNDILQS